jgi:hypothetical protein
MQNMGVIVCLQNMQHVLYNIVFLIVPMSSVLEVICICILHIYEHMHIYMSLHFGPRILESNTGNFCVTTECEILDGCWIY